MTIAIIDILNQDIGLKIVFPSADYYIKHAQECTRQFRLESYNHYNFTPIEDWTNINDINYDTLFIILPSCEVVIENHEIKSGFYDIEKIINKNKFKFVAIFDNYDYDYDPNDFIKTSKIDLFFKRNYNSNKKYRDNVVPFPFITFGVKNMIEKIDRLLVPKDLYFNSKEDRVFFTGSLFHHVSSDEFGVNRNRQETYDSIKDTIFNPGNLNNDIFMYLLRTSKYGLDLLGVGDPNTRTIEILLSGSLKLGEFNDLKWPFPDKFSNETIFKDKNEYLYKLNNLQTNKELYDKCLENQFTIVEKYFNLDFLRNYIIDKVNCI